MNSNQPLSSETRRLMVLAISIVLICGALIVWKFGDESWSVPVANGMGRIGIVMAGLWLAWPSLRRPANWLPPGIAVACVLGLVVVAANRSLIVFVVPALGALTVLATIVRSTRSNK